MFKRAKYIIKGFLAFKNKDPDRFLFHSSGVVHVGANVGGERHAYDWHDLYVAWFEPIPEVFARLNSNVSDFSKQIAINQLIADQDDKEFQFNVSNNKGASSSILNFKMHQDLWPDIAYTESLTLNSKTLASLIESGEIDMHKYDALVLDTQGSELLVLQGLKDYVRNFKYIKVEVADFEAYEGCCDTKDIEAFMHENAYKEFSRDKWKTVPNIGSYYDITYENTNYVRYQHSGTST